MKNYFNEKERTNHIILMCMEYVAQEFESSNALSEEEKKQLKNISKCCKKLNESVFERFGDCYRRKIDGTLKSNTLRLVGNYSAYNECVSHCASEDIEPKVKDLMLFNCINCKQENYKDCAMYAMGVTCGILGKDTDGCPYKSTIEDEDIF